MHTYFYYFSLSLSHFLIVPVYLFFITQIVLPCGVQHLCCTRSAEQAVVQLHTRDMGRRRHFLHCCWCVSRSRATASVQLLRSSVSGSRCVLTTVPVMVNFSVPLIHSFIICLLINIMKHELLDKRKRAGWTSQTDTSLTAKRAYKQKNT